jgi:NAD(P)-dependent dehydrogenase (short-subunit alcohol dehydrogenase family)
VIAIFGANGRVGGAAARALLDRGLPVRAVVRDTGRAAVLGERGAELVTADLRVPDDVARAVKGADAALVVCPMLVQALPRGEWVPALTRGGLGPSYAGLVATMFDAHNAGRIDVDPHADQVRHGPTELREVLAPLLS